MVYLYIVIVVRTPGGAWAAASLGGARKPASRYKKKKTTLGWVTTQDKKQTRCVIWESLKTKYHNNTLESE